MNWIDRRVCRSHAIGVFGLLLAVWVLLLPGEAMAQDMYVNEETGYHVVIEDEADLLTDAEETALVEEMKPVTQYGNVAFHSVSSHNGGYYQYAEDFYHYCFGTASGTALIVDMQDRKLTIYSDGAVYDVVTGTRADTITDNIYRMASRGDYYGCAAEMYREATALLKGDEIAKPMKYISNALLAILLAMLINFLRIRRASKLKAAEVDAIVNSAAVSMSYGAARAVFSHESRKYDPLPKGGGSSGGHGGGSRGGGGGHSGGGGSHGF